MAQSYQLRERFQDYALATQRKHGWLRAQDDFRNILTDIAKWRAQSSGHPLEEMNRYDDLLVSMERIEFAYAMEQHFQRAAEGRLELVSQRFYKKMYDAYYNRLEADKFDDGETGYKSYWHDLKEMLQERIDNYGDRSREKYRADTDLTELATVLRLKALCRQVIDGTKLTEAFNSVYSAESPRAWYPPSLTVGNLAGPDEQKADMIKNKYEQLSDNIAMLHVNQGLEKSANVLQPHLTEEHLASRQETLKQWLSAIIREYDRFAPFKDGTPENQGWMEKHIDTTAFNLGTTVDAAREEERRLRLPLRPSWQMLREISRPDGDLLSALHSPRTKTAPPAFPRRKP